MQINGINSFNAMSKSKKAAAITGAAVGVAALATTAIAFKKGKNVEGADKFFKKIGEGYKQIGAEIAEKFGKIKEFFAEKFGKKTASETAEKAAEVASEVQ